ncbi:LD-carboxypeptidase, partial [candidate division FCPU426 bacterium]|nr:LD-carboxypeptidase [candidate division FCPU426 bacterium]
LAMQKAGLVSFWGPMPAAATGLTAFARKWLARAVMSAQPLGVLPAGSLTIRAGKAVGRTTGGTLTLLAASLGTAYELQTRNRIVFIEDTGEEPYRLDRMLTHLLAAGKLADAAGIALGVFRNCASKAPLARHTFSVREVLHERLRPLGIPVFSGLPVGHIADQVTLPYGVLARMDAGRRTLAILEPGVK